MSPAILEDPAVEGLNSYIGTNNGSVLSNGEMLVALKPPAVRKMTIQQVIARLRERLAQGAGRAGLLHADPGPGTRRAEQRLALSVHAHGERPDHLAQWADRMRRAMADLKGTLTDVINSNEIAGLQAGLEIDRVRAAAMGVTPLAVDNTLYDAFGQRQIRTIWLPHNYSRVDAGGGAGNAGRSCLAQHGVRAGNRWRAGATGGTDTAGA